MSRNGTLAMYDEFDDNDNIEGNDDDMAALGSILSWDEAEDNYNVASKSDDEIAGAASGRSNFDAMQFAARNGNTQLNFLNNSSSNAFGQNTGAIQQDFQLPLSAMPAYVQQVASSQQLPPTSLAETGAAAEQQTIVNQPQQMGIQLNFSPEQQQFIAQNPQAFAQFLATTVLQQQQISQPQQQQISQPQQQNQQQQISLPQQQQQVSLAMFQNASVPQSIQQSQAAPRKQMQTLQVQQQPHVQPPSDANALLQQFQIAQFQQQLQAAQAQPNLQIQSALQQLQAQFAQAQGNVTLSQDQQTSRQASTDQVRAQPVVPLPQEATQLVGSMSKPVSSQTSKKSKLMSHDTKKSVAKTPPKTKLPTTKSTDTSMAGTVSASDTEAEASWKAKSSRTMSSPINDDDMDLSHLSPSEKLKASRDRNREHARNTRLRKKAYLEKLKSTVDELCRERDTLVSERAGAASLLVEMHNIHTEVLMSFLALRTSNERRRKLWSSILDESCFACVMPVTPYRSFPASEVQVSKCLRTVLGIDGMIADTASLHVLFDSLIDRSLHPYGKIDFRYTLVTEEAVVAGNQMMARWVMTTTNAVQYGARMEVAKQGMLCCKFNSAHKIIGLELMFDVMAFMLQLKQASGTEGFTVIPNTVQTCQRSFDKPMVVTLAEPPYTIIQVNKLWEDMTGYSADEVVGRTSCAVLQCVDMDKTCLNRMMDEVRYKRPASAMLVNRRKSGEDFTNFLVVYPLSTDSRITYYLGLSLYNGPGKPSGTAGLIHADSVNRHQSVQANPPSIPASSVNVPGVLGQSNQSVISSMMFPGLCCLPSANQSSLTQLCTTSQTQFLQPGQTGSCLGNIGSNMGTIQNNSSGNLKRHRENDSNCSL